MYDTIIIGAGPAGMTAGIYAARRELKTLIISKDVGGQMVWASEIENYPGLKKINSAELIQNMQEHVNSFGVEIVTAEVKKISKNNKTFKVFTANGVFEAKTVISTMGLSPRRLAIKGENEFQGSGVTYCANCDGPFYRNKIVAVVGGGNSALDAAEVMSKIAKQVYLIHRREKFTAFNALVNEVKSIKNLEICSNQKVFELKGDNKLKQVILEDVSTGKFREISIDGIFIEIGRIAHTDLLADFVDRNKRDEIIVNEKCETKTPGLYAAGDVTQSLFKQISVAIGQATVAALSAYQYMQLQSGKEAGRVLDRSIPKK